jgi:hypothetical protein
MFEECVMPFLEDEAPLHLHIAAQVELLESNVPTDRGKQMRPLHLVPRPSHLIPHDIFFGSTQRMMFSFHYCQLLFIPVALPS